MGGQATWSPQSSGKIAIETLEYTGWGLSFQKLEMSYLWGTGASQNFLWKYQMKNSIIPTLSENFNKINQRWPQLEPQTWSEVNL